MRLLPAELAFRNAGRRPVRTLVAVFSSFLVTAVLAGTVAVVGGLEGANLGASPPKTGILLSNAAQRDLVRSAIDAAVADIVSADVPGIAQIGGRPAVSPEVHLTINLAIEDDPTPRQGFIRGVTEAAFLVHDAVAIVSGRAPGPGEALIGRLAAARLGLRPDELGEGARLHVDEGTFTVSGVFHAPGTTIESEIWVPLVELQGHVNREDVSGVFVRVSDERVLSRLDLFAQRNLDLELVHLSAEDYYRELAAYFGPLRGLAWTMAILIAISALFTGANIQNAAVQDRVRELAALRAMGWSGSALVVLLVQEALFVASLGALLGLLVARILVDGLAVQLAMTAFALQVQGPAILVSFLGALLVTFTGILPAAVQVLRLPIATALKEEG